MVHDANHVECWHLHLKLLSDSNLGTYNGGVKDQLKLVRIVYLRRYMHYKNEENILNHIKDTLS